MLILGWTTPTRTTQVFWLVVVSLQSSFGSGDCFMYVMRWYTALIPASFSMWSRPPLRLKVSGAMNQALADVTTPPTTATTAPYSQATNFF